MKKLATLAVGVSTAFTGMSYGASYENTTAMLYYQLPFDGKKQLSNSSYGFALNYDVSAGTFSTKPPVQRTLVDFGFQKQQLQTMKLNGVTLVTRDKQTNQLNVGGAELGTTDMIILGGIVIGGVLCIAEEVICEDSDPAPPPPAD